MKDVPKKIRDRIEEINDEKWTYYRDHSIGVPGRFGYADQKTLDDIYYTNSKGLDISIGRKSKMIGDNYYLRIDSSEKKKYEVYTGKEVKSLFKSLKKKLGTDDVAYGGFEGSIIEKFDSDKEE